MLLTAVAALVLAAPAPLPRPGPPQTTYLGIEATAAPGGLHIDTIYIASPAEQAGLRSGMTITSIAGQKVSSLPELAAILRKCKPNESITLVTRFPGEADDQSVLVKLAPRRALCYLGASLNATRIIDMPENSPARRAGLKPGDAILRIADRPVSTSQEVVASINMHRPGDTVPFVVNREGAEVKIPVRLGERPGY